MEQKENKYLFKTRILSYHQTREVALQEELRLQIKHDVVSNPNYFNESLATINGMFGRSVEGKTNPNFGNVWTSEQKKNLSEITNGCKYYNDGKIVKRIYDGADIPEGFQLGILKTPPAKDKIWVNKNNVEYYIEPSMLDSSYSIGRITKSMKNKMSITNGITSTYIDKSKPIPSGWRKGPMKYKCTKCNNYFDAGNFKKHTKTKCICFSLSKGNITSSKLYSKEDLSKIFGGLIKTDADNPLGTVNKQHKLLTRNKKSFLIGCFIKEIL